MNWRLLVKILLAGGVLVFLLFGGLVAYVIHQQRAYRNLKDSHDLKARVARMGQEYVAKRSEAGLVIGVIQAGKTYVSGFGKGLGTNSLAPDGETIYEIGSVTKVFTAVALAALVKANGAALDDPISRYLPREATAPQFNGREITLKHLATHTSGLPRLPDNLEETIKDQQNPYVNYHAAELYKGVSAARLTKEPGVTSSYSNFGFGLLGHLLALKAGKSYEALVVETICQPLGMSNTLVQLSNGQRQRMIAGHNTSGQIVPYWDFDALAGAGSLRSTASDLLMFVQANLETNHPSLDPALSLARQIHHQAFIGNVGLGWQIREPAPATVLHWHNGGTGGFASFIGFNRAARVGVVILSNYGDAMIGNSAVDGMGMEILKYAPKISWE